MKGEMEGDRERREGEGKGRKNDREREGKEMKGSEYGKWGIERKEFHGIFFNVMFTLSVEMYPTIHLLR